MDPNERVKPEVAVLFYKPASSVVGAEDAIVIPESARGENNDYEVELAVVMGKDAKNVSVENALEYVLGYCTSNDVSVLRSSSRSQRADAWDDLQVSSRGLCGKGIQWGIGKSYDSESLELGVCSEGLADGVCVFLQSLVPSRTRSRSSLPYFRPSKACHQDDRQWPSQATVQHGEHGSLSRASLPLRANDFPAECLRRLSSFPECRKALPSKRALSSSPCASSSRLSPASTDGIHHTGLSPAAPPRSGQGAVPQARRRRSGLGRGLW